MPLYYTILQKLALSEILQDDEQHHGEPDKTSTREVVADGNTDGDTEDPAVDGDDDDQPIPINGWEDATGTSDNMNPDGQQCFKQRYFKETFEYQNTQKCETVMEDSCGTVFFTRFKASKVSFKDFTR